MRMQTVISRSRGSIALTPMISLLLVILATAAGSSFKSIRSSEALLLASNECWNAIMEWEYGDSQPDNWSCAGDPRAVLVCGPVHDLGQEPPEDIVRLVATIQTRMNKSVSYEAIVKKR